MGRATYVYELDSVSVLSMDLWPRSGWDLVCPLQVDAALSLLSAGKQKGELHVQPTNISFT